MFFRCHKKKKKTWKMSEIYQEMWKDAKAGQADYLDDTDSLKQKAVDKNIKKKIDTKKAKVSDDESETSSSELTHIYTDGGCETSSSSELTHVFTDGGSSFLMHQADNRNIKKKIATKKAKATDHESETSSDDSDTMEGAMHFSKKLKVFPFV